MRSSVLAVKIERKAKSEFSIQHSILACYREPLEVPMDSSSTESIIQTAYALISGRAGEPRDWNRWKSLHADGARLIPIGTADGGPRTPNVMTPDEFIESRSRIFEKEDFYEWETARQEFRFGQLVHVWSSYEAARQPNGAPIRKGVNSIQLWHDGSRYWILSVAWDATEAVTAAKA